jgi:hypothetical protein
MRNSVPMYPKRHKTLGVVLSNRDKARVVYASLFTYKYKQIEAPNHWISRRTSPSNATAWSELMTNPHKPIMPRNSIYLKPKDEIVLKKRETGYAFT